MAGMFDGLDWGMLATGMPTPGIDPLNPPSPDFAQRFGAAFPRAGGDANTIPPSPISPEAVASNLAARGVPPPKVDIPPAAASPTVGAALTGNDVVNPGQPYRMAGPQAMDEWRNSVDVKNAGVTSDPVSAPSGPAPMNIQTPVQQQQVAQASAPTDMSASAKKSGTGDTLLDALKGIKAPAAPELQRLGTPAAPRPTGTVKSGQLLALLQSLNAGASVGDRNLPSTLASALRRG